MRYEVKRSNRKTIALQVLDEGFVVKAPLHASDADIDLFVRKNQAWIEKQSRIIEERKAEVKKLGALTMEDINELADKALKYIPARVEHYAGLIGVSYGRITIRNQKSKWGSCSSKGNLNFNCLLMLTPPEVIDSIVVHELCHRKVMNHSREFYEEVLKVFPDYWKWNKWLKENGSILMQRMKVGMEY